VGLLDQVRAAKKRELDAEVDKIRAIIEWCAAHEVPADEAATYVEFGRDTGLALGGEGAPYVSEFAVMELAAAMGMSTEACRRQVGRILEVRYRLPWHWQEVAEGRLEFWRAARTAEATISLPKAGAAYVDRKLARTASKVTVGQIDRLVTEALQMFDPEAAEEKRKAAMDSRHVTVHTKGVGSDGVVDITATADLADALDFDNRIATEAADLKALGCDESLDVRRSMALGTLARRQTTLDLSQGDPDGPVKARQVDIRVHVSEDSDHGRCDNTRSMVSVEQVKGWCTNPDTQVVIRPVLDLDDHVQVDRYERPRRLDDQIRERDVVCSHPWCSRPAAGCDIDHVIPYARGGTTCTCNLAPSCRGHHRAKTHGGWTAIALEPGRYLWRSPHGFWFHKGPQGTLDLGHLTPP